MCNCEKLSFCLGNIIYVSEKLATCCALTAVVTCLITTIILMLIFGIGIGYNYCYVDFKAKRSDEFYGTLATLTTTKKILRTISMKKESEFHQKPDVITTMIVDQTKYPAEDDFRVPSLRASKIRRKSKNRSVATVSQSPLVIRNTMIVPPRVDVDILSLLSKIRAHNKNVTLEIIAS